MSNVGLCAKLGAASLAIILGTTTFLQAFATLASTSPDTVIYATATRTSTGILHVHGSAGSISFYHYHFFPAPHPPSAPPPVITYVGQTTGTYTLDVKSLMPLTIGVTGDLNDGTALQITWSDASTSSLGLGTNPLTPPAKGTATISVVPATPPTIVADAIAALPPPPVTGSCGSTIPFIGCLISSSPAPTMILTSSASSEDGFTVAVDQPNAGGPKPRLSQASGANRLELSSTVTQFIDIPRGGATLTVTTPTIPTPPTGGPQSIEVFDQHGNSRGGPLSGTVTVTLGSGDYSGLWKIVVTGTTGDDFKLSASVDGTSLALHSEATRA